ncbi:unnamed protein product [Meganyctiphanes norvegica]|uniref:Uncharacterized protein n=1 Tax=Meganyctiphanes norvegica TaxID=48144 RepID=A0AAV2PQ63_MEGNR
MIRFSRATFKKKIRSLCPFWTKISYCCLTSNSDSSIIGPPPTAQIFAQYNCASLIFVQSCHTSRCKQPVKKVNKQVYWTKIRLAQLYYAKICAVDGGPVGH